MCRRAGGLRQSPAASFVTGERRTAVLDDLYHNRKGSAFRMQEKDPDMGALPGTGALSHRVNSVSLTDEAECIHFIYPCVVCVGVPDLPQHFLHFRKQITPGDILLQLFAVGETFLRNILFSAVP